MSAEQPQSTRQGEVAEMGIIIDLDGMHDHEGYAARRLPDGTLTSVWTAQTRAFTGYVAACACGWHATSDHDHPPTEAGYDAATDQWYRTHATQVLGRLAQRDRRELAEILRALGGIAAFVDDPASLDRITRAADRARRLAEHLRQTTRATQREAGHER
jgi:hypothetical protein